MVQGELQTEAGRVQDVRYNCKLASPAPLPNTTTSQQEL